MKTKRFGLFLSAFALLGCGLCAQPDPEITAVLTANPTEYSGPCPAVIHFAGQITSSAASRVQYKFIRSDNANAPVQTIEFRRPGTLAVSATWTLGGAQLPNYSGWEAIQVVYPVPVTSNRAAFRMTCGNEPDRRPPPVDCRPAYPRPIIRFDHQDDEGRVYIPVVNFSAFPDQLFTAAPDLPPCGTNTSASRTWVDIYDARTNRRVYGFCALASHTDLKNIWFSSDAKSGAVYILMHDRRCNKSYRSNTLLWGPCTRIHPRPIIRFSHRDDAGRVHIPVVNFAAFPDELFAAAPDLPPCGANANSSRTWIDIYNGQTNARLYGFCALGSGAGLKDIWFTAPAPHGLVYIIMVDRRCNRNYRSNTIRY